MRVRFLKEARDDIDRTARHYDTQTAGLGSKFRAEVRAVTERIRKLPESCPILEDDLRQGMTARFPYGIIYRVTPGEALVLAVSHLHREPGRWRDRI